LVLQLFLAYGLKYLWNLINLFQFLVFFLQWKISIDETTEIYLQAIKSLALFEFLDTGLLVQKFRAFVTGVPLESIQCQDGDIDDFDICKNYMAIDLEDDDDSELLVLDTDAYVQDKQTERLGSPSLLANLGSFLVYGVGMILTALVVIMLRPFTRKNPTINKILKKLQKTFLWNGFLRFIIQGSLKM
jgi:hypothetical protein